MDQGSASFAAAAAAATPADGQRYVGSSDDVEGIVRQFASDVLNLYDPDSGVSPDDAPAVIQTKCTDAAKLFADQDGQAVAQRVLDVMGDKMPGDLVNQSPERVIAEAFAVLAHHIFDALDTLSEDGDAEAAGDTVNALVEDWTRLLIGTPTDEDVIASQVRTADPASDEPDVANDV